MKKRQDKRARFLPRENYGREKTPVKMHAKDYIGAGQTVDVYTKSGDIHEMFVESVVSGPDKYGWYKVVCKFVRSSYK